MICFFLMVSSESVVATPSGKQTHSEGQRREWSAVYCIRGPKAESLLSQWLLKLVIEKKQPKGKCELIYSISLKMHYQKQDSLF